MKTDDQPDESSNRAGQCANARTLVASYLDGELSEIQAAPLRVHLFACRDCREVAKDEKALKRWFQAALAEAGSPQAPAGFSARVARRAFAGERGSDEPAVVSGASGSNGSSTSPSSVGGPRRRDLMPLLLALSAAAAVLLLAAALALEARSLPSGTGLRADTYQPPWVREHLRAEALSLHQDRPAESESPAETAAQER
jgi:anti-sigma factor RsiW